jgi:hypothetical protein
MRTKTQTRSHSKLKSRAHLHSLSYAQYKSENKIDSTAMALKPFHESMVPDFSGTII